MESITPLYRCGNDPGAPVLCLPATMDVGAETWETDVRGTHADDAAPFVVTLPGRLDRTAALVQASQHARRYGVHDAQIAGYVHRLVRRGSSVEIRRACARVGIDVTRVRVTHWNTTRPPVAGSLLIGAFRVRMGDPAMGVWLLPEGRTCVSAFGCSPV